MTKNRLETFSDGVLAIIITIMVLELKVPHGTELKGPCSGVPLFLKLYFKLYIPWYLLEQPSPHDAYS